MALLGLPMLLTGCLGFTGPEQPPAMDSDGNKIFDSLERLMEQMGPEETVPVLVLMGDYSDTQRLAEVGEVQVKFQYAIVPAVAASLTRSQIEALARKEYVKHIEHDAEVRVMMNTASQYFGVTKARQDFGVSGDRDGAPASYSTDDLVVAVIDTGKSITDGT